MKKGTRTDKKMGIQEYVKTKTDKLDEELKSANVPDIERENVRWTMEAIADLAVFNYKLFETLDNFLAEIGMQAEARKYLREHTNEDDMREERSDD